MTFNKSILLFGLLLSLLFTVESCSNDFQLTEGAVDLAIVYGVLEVNDTAHYVRVERAFVDEKTSAYVLSKDPAQLYFSDITVKLIHVKTGKETIMQRVDGNLEGYVRADGVFATSPNYLYKAKKADANLVGGEEYQLKISRNDGSEIASAKSLVLAPFENSDVTNPSPTSLIAFQNNADFKVRWFGDDNGVIHDVMMTFNLVEEKNGQFTDKSITWTLDKNLSKNELNVKGTLFYEFMQGALEKDPAIKRYFEDLTLTISSGGQDIKNYISIGQANLGITSSGEIPVYTNIEGDGLGLFSSKATFVRSEMKLANNTLDSLRYGVVTKSLNFQ